MPLARRCAAILYGVFAIAILGMPSLLFAANPRTFSSLLITPAATNIIEASRLAAYKLPRDSVALAALDQALKGHSFQAESLPPAKKP